MVKRLINLLVICVMISPVLLTSCQKDLYDPTVTVVSKEATDLNFSTTQNVKFNLTFDVPTGYVAEFDLYTENPCTVLGSQIVLKENVKPIGTCVSVSGSFAGSKQFPAYVSELYAYSPSLFAPRLLHATILNGTANFETVNLSADSQTKASTRNAWTGRSEYSVRENIDNTKIVSITGDMLQKINDTFKQETRVDEKYYQDASIYLKQDAQVWVTPLRTDGTFYNELLYFCYDGPKENLGNLTQAEREALPLISILQGKIGEQLTIGSYVKLKYYKDGQFYDTFPAETTIVWALLPYYNGIPYKDGLTFYSYPGWNPENGTTVTKNHTTFFNAGTTADPFVCFGFEDMPNDKRWNGYGDNDCDDMMFNVQLDPIDALNPPPTIDEEPEDVYASQSYVGYLGFEDYWPQYFDYDLNDLLVKYQSKVNTQTQTGKNADTNTYITTIEDQYSMVFIGADFDNHFSVSVPFSRDLIEKVTITDESNKTQTIQGSSLEKDRNGFILDICDSPQSVITAYDRETDPYTYKVVITLKNKVLTMADFESNTWMAPYNPFITPYYPGLTGRSGELEVHLPGSMPTYRVIDIPYWFGAFDDRSDVSAGIYYIGGDKVYDMNGDFIEKNIFPFAIHLAGVEDFYIPDEHIRIDKTFPRYRTWAESNMTTDKDWYLNRSNP